MEKLEKTLGEKRVRTAFNVAGSEKDSVDAIKQRTAALIDFVNSLPFPKEGYDPRNSEQARLKSIAMTKYEEAAMWAVKAATA